MPSQTETDLVASFRELIGNPPPREVPNSRVLSFIRRGLEALAAKLKYAIRTDRQIALVEDEPEIDLPSDFGHMVYVRLGTTLLEPASTWAWERDGLDWQSAASGTPSQYAVMERKLVLYPPPNDDTIEDTPLLEWRYIGSSAGLAPDGTPLLGDSDQTLALYFAAMEYYSVYPTDENLKRLPGIRELLGMRLPDALKRHEGVGEQLHESFKVFTRRTGAGC